LEFISSSYYLTQIIQITVAALQWKEKNEAPKPQKFNLQCV